MPGDVRGRIEGDGPAERRDRTSRPIRAGLKSWTIHPRAGEELGIPAIRCSLCDSRGTQESAEFWPRFVRYAQLVWRAVREVARLTFLLPITHNFEIRSAIPRDRLTAVETHQGCRKLEIDCFWASVPGPIRRARLIEEKVERAPLRASFKGQSERHAGLL